MTSAGRHTRGWLWLLLCAGCSDVFALPFATADLGGAVADRDMAANSDGSPARGDGGPSLPASCARLPCTPLRDEGDVNLSSGTISGCHAYDRLTITASVQALQLYACADSIDIAGSLSANGGGDPAETGQGAGGACAGVGGASGGGHGGGGADPGGCGGGMPFGDSALPREAGSGGGGETGGSGGGIVELACGSLNLLTLISADGTDGSGDSAGGGAGGSVLIEADSVVGGGRIEARGGRGVGAKGGGGGGGRVAIYGSASTARFDIDVAGGASSTGNVGGTGTIVQ